MDKEEQEIYKNIIQPMQEEQAREQNYENFGWQNDWEVRPMEYMECCKAGHQRREENIGKCQWQVYCDICMITWKYDSSD